MGDQWNLAVLTYSLLGVTVAIVPEAVMVHPTGGKWRKEISQLASLFSGCPGPGGRGSWWCG
jgi:hypothetical protein